MHEAVLDVSRMSRKECWNALERRLVLLNPDVMVAVPYAQKRVAYWEALMLAKELRKMGVQMELPLRKG